MMERHLHPDHTKSSKRLVLIQPKEILNSSENTLIICQYKNENHLILFTIRFKDSYSVMESGDNVDSIASPVNGTVNSYEIATLSFAELVGTAETENALFSSKEGVQNFHSPSEHNTYGSSSGYSQCSVNEQEISPLPLDVQLLNNIHDSVGEVEEAQISQSSRIESSTPPTFNESGLTPSQLKDLAMLDALIDNHSSVADTQTVNSIFDDLVPAHSHFNDEDYSNDLSYELELYLDNVHETLTVIDNCSSQNHFITSPSPCTVSQGNNPSNQSNTCSQQSRLNETVVPSQDVPHSDNNQYEDYFSNDLSCELELFLNNVYETHTVIDNCSSQNHFITSSRCTVSQGNNLSDQSNTCKYSSQQSTLNETVVPSQDVPHSDTNQYEDYFSNDLSYELELFLNNVYETHTVIDNCSSQNHFIISPSPCTVTQGINPSNQSNTCKYSSQQSTLNETVVLSQDVPHSDTNQYKSRTVGVLIRVSVPSQSRKLRPILPGPPVPKTVAISGKERLLQRLNPVKAIEAKAKVAVLPEGELVRGNEDGDNHLMILVSKPHKNLLELVYALVERMRLIPGALEASNNSGESALYIASVSLPGEPVVARYLAETLLDMDVNIAELTYENGQSLAHCVSERGDSHRHVLAELLSLKDPDSNHPVFNLNKPNDRSGHTPLHVAACSHGKHNVCSIATVRLLVKQGANLLEQMNSSRSYKEDYFDQLPTSEMMQLFKDLTRQLSGGLAGWLQCFAHCCSGGM